MQIKVHYKLNLMREEEDFILRGSTLIDYWWPSSLHSGPIERSNWVTQLVIFSSNGLRLNMKICGSSKQQ